MMYEIVFTHKALKDLNSLDKKIKVQIINKIKEYSISPFDNARKLIDKKLGQFRYRIGDYRVIFDIDENKIVILKIGHRKEIYD
jgi:mRNA interferase RelE/StbE